MAVVGTAYVHIKAIANNMAKDIEKSLQPLSQNMAKMGQDAGKNYSDGFNKSIADGSKDTNANPVAGLNDNVDRELDKTKETVRKKTEDAEKSSRSPLAQLAENFKNTGKKSSNNFVQNFGMGPWFKMIHGMYDAFLFLSPAIGVAGGAITQLVGGLTSMATSLAPVVNLVGVLPGLYYGLASSMIATNIGLKDSLGASKAGFEAMKAVATGAADADKKMQKYQEALKALGPDARTFTETLVGMSGKFMDIGSNIEHALLPKLTEALVIIRDNGTIDAFGRSFEGVAGNVGNTALNLAKLSDTPFFRGNLTTVFESTNKVTGLFGDSLVNIINVLVAVAAAASPVTEEFAAWIRTVTGNWAKRAEGNFGGLQQSFRDAADIAKQMGRIIGNLWGVLKNLGKAGSDAGKSLWNAFEGATQRWKDFTGSVEGQNKLKTFFDNSARSTKALGDAFAEAGKALGNLAASDKVAGAMEGLAPMVEQFGDMILRMVDEAGPALGEMMQALLDLLDTVTEGQGISAFAETITVFAKALNGLLNMPGGHGILIFLATFIGIFKASSIIAQVTGFRGAVSGLFKTLNNVKTSGGVTSYLKGIKTEMKGGERVTTGYANGFTGSMRMVAGSAKRGMKNIPDMTKRMTESFKSAPGKIKNSMAAIGTTLTGGTLVRDAGKAGKAAGNNIATGVSSSTGKVTASANKAGAGVSGAFSRAGKASAGAFSGVAGAARTAGGGVVKGFSAAGAGAVGAMNKAGGAIKGGFGKTMGLIGRMNPFGFILTAVELLLPIFITLYQTSDTFRNSVNGAFKAIGDAVAPLMPILQSLWKTVSGVFKSIIEAVGPPLMSAFSSVAGGLSTAFQAILPAVQQILGAIGPIIGQLFQAIGPVLQQLGQTLGQVFSQLGPVLAQVFGQIGPILTQMGPMVAQVFGQLGGAVGQLLPMLGQLVGSVLSQLGPILAQIVPIVGQLAMTFYGLISGALAQLIPVIINLVQTVLPPLMGAFKSIMQLVGVLVSTVLPPLVQLFGTVLTQVLQALIPIIIAVINAIVPIITAIVQTLTGLITFLTGVFTGNWQMAWDGIKQMFVGWWNFIVALVTGVISILVAIFTAWWNNMKNVALTVGAALYGAISGVMNGIKNFVSGVINGIKNFFVNGWNGIKNATVNSFNAVKNSITNTLNAAKSIASNIVSGIKNAVSNAWNAVKNATSNAWNAVKSAVSKGINGAKSVVSSVVGSIRSTISSAWNSVKSMTNNAWNAFKGAVSRGVNGAMSVVRGIPGKIRGAFGNASSMLVNIGRNIIQGLKNGISRAAGGVMDAVRNITNKIPKVIRDKMGIHSPSRVTRDLGKFIGQGFANGIKGTAKSVEGATNELTKKVQSAFKAKAISKKTYERSLSVIRSSNKKLVSLAKDREAVAARLKASQDKLNEAVKTRNDFSVETKNSMIGTLDLGDITKGMDFTKVLNVFKTSTAQVKSFQSNLKKLKDMGLNQDLYRQILSAGAERGSELATSLLQNGKAGIIQINREFNNLTAASAGVGNESADYLYGAGVNIAKAMVKGLQSQEKALANQASKMAKSVTSAVKKALKIKSPSRVFMEIGEMTAQGLVEGLNDMATTVAAAAGTLGTATIAGATDAMSAGITPSINNIAAPVAPLSTSTAAGALSATIVGSSADDNPVLTPQNQALVEALGQYMGTQQTNYFNIQKDKSIQQLAQEISRELERTK